jgi:hypothetical protein
MDARGVVYSSEDEKVSIIGVGSSVEHGRRCGALLYKRSIGRTNVKSREDISGAGDALCIFLKSLLRAMPRLKAMRRIT